MEETGKARGKGCLLFTLVLLAVLTPIGYYYYQILDERFLEQTAPVIEVVGDPRGIGEDGLHLVINVYDGESGLDEVVVRARQKGGRHQLFKEKYAGRKSAVVDFTVERDDLDFEEGTMSIQIRAFDRSIWSNRGEEILELFVDYQAPQLRILSTQHNARQGGAQLVFYKAVDNELRVSGVEIGGKKFVGYPAQNIDPVFDNPSIFFALYAVDQEPDPASLRPVVFVEDSVGNRTSQRFPNKRLRRRKASRTIAVNDEAVLKRLHQTIAQSSDLLPEGVSDSPSNEEVLQTYVGELYQASERKLQALLEEAGSADEQLWIDTFLRTNGSPEGRFGDKVSLVVEGTEVATLLRHGFERLIPRVGERRPVHAAHDGRVLFDEVVGVYGRVLALDHGLGLTSLYGYLNEVSVDVGSFVKRGEVIGTAGKGGFAKSAALYFEMRVHGLPVNPLEWWDVQWFQDHVFGKIDDVKQTLGLPVYRRKITLPR